MVLATRAGSGLTPALKPELTALIADLRDRIESDPERLAQWRLLHTAALKAQRSAASWTEWSNDQLTQAAVGWLLGTVFVRFCEDNRLLGGHVGSRTNGVWITSNDETRRERALDDERTFYLADSDYSYREWLETAFAVLGANDATAELVGDHSAIRIAEPTSDAVNRLLTFWRRTDDNGSLVWDFQDDKLSTRFLGDLYQDLSDHAKSTYALLQTPEFVEEFILDQTLTPALKERPLEGFRLIDPTCGSGHFLLGAFHRFFALWQAKEPGLEPRTLVNKALGSVYGVDLNPFAVAISRFRLLVAAIQASGDVTLIDLPEFSINVVAGDSLLHGVSQRILTPAGDVELDEDMETDFAYSTEDLQLFRKFLVSGHYDVVVGNPPYIEVRDRAVKARYKTAYPRLSGSHMFPVLFMQRFFELARQDPRPGWIGQITSNGFMKRQYGKGLINGFLSKLDLRLIVDTAGVFLPGHGTPTVILVGRNSREGRDSIHAVLGIQGEPGKPSDPKLGLVWQAIQSQLHNTGYSDEWISVVDMPRASLTTHPWNLAGGGESDLVDRIGAGRRRLASAISGRIGFASFPGTDDAFVAPARSLIRQGVPPELIKSIIVGDRVRDWSLNDLPSAFTPYDSSLELIPLDMQSGWYRRQWPLRSLLQRDGIDKSGTKDASEVAWWAWYRWIKERLREPLSIAFAEVATHNHFVLDRGGSVYKQTAPVIKLPKESTLDDYLRLVGFLSSSTACFWLRQNCHDKGRPGAEAAGADEPWEHRFQFNGQTVQQIPLPAGDVLDRARRMDELASRLLLLEPHYIIEHNGISIEAFRHAEIESERLKRLLVAEQEELDWDVYKINGLVDHTLLSPSLTELSSSDLQDGEVGILPGERPFAIQLARRVKDGQTSTSWFSHHNHRHASTTEIPSHWPRRYSQLATRRLEMIASDRYINLLERPEYKRRWQQESWSKRLTAALRDYLLDRLETTSLWFNEQYLPQARSVSELAGVVETSPDFVDFLDALDQWVGRKGAPVTESLNNLLDSEVVPYLAALRYKPSGLRKRAEWESTWAEQRKEDEGTRPEGADRIPAPPVYAKADFQKDSYWSHRGNLDVPNADFRVANRLLPASGHVTPDSLSGKGIRPTPVTSGQ